MKFWRNFKDFILSFFYPRNKIYVISFPNSGRTWLKHMLFEIIKELHINELNIEFSHDNSEIIIEDGTRIDPNIIFQYTDRYKYRRAKVIFLCRDPRDIIASNYHQVTKRERNPFIFNKFGQIDSELICLVILFSRKVVFKGSNPIPLIDCSK